jgi:hypothetical protein
MARKLQEQNHQNRATAEDPPARAKSTQLLCRPTDRADVTASGRVVVLVLGT